MSSILETRIDIKFLMKNNLMNGHMIAKLINERKLFIQQAATEEISKEECLRLISIELNVMNMCSLAIKTNFIPKTWFINESISIMKLICNRIDHLYYSMFQMFSIECVLLIEYMEFQSDYAPFITNEIYPLLVLMSKKKFEPQMYIAAATFEYEKQNIEKARQYLVEGIKNHTDNKLLYLEQLWIEVMYLDDVEGEELNEIRSIQVYKNIIRHFENDMEFHIALLDRSLEIKPIYRLQYEIVCDLMEIYKESDVMWHKVATLCLEGFIFDHDISFFGYVQEFRERARCCILTYYEGLKHVSSVTKKKNLMFLLSDYIIKLWKHNKDINNLNIKSLVIKEMKKAFQIGHFDFGGLHKPEYYVYWAMIPSENLPEIFQLAIDLNKDNVQVWVEILEYNVVHFDCYTKVKSIFDAGNLALGNKSLPLWEIMDLFLQQYCDVTLLGEFYENGANSPHQEISTVYKVDFLEWCHMYDGISSARELFKQLITAEPNNKKLFMNMIVYERLQRPIHLNIIRNLFRIACLRFCRQGDNIGIWEKFIEFELTNVGSSSAKKIFMDALQIVKPHLKTTLKRNYQLINEAHSRHVVPIQPVITEISDDEE